MTAMWRTALVTLLSHYRRHPGQLAMLLLGLWVASALWSGVQAINASARDSYARAEALLTAQLDRIERRDGTPLTLTDYVALRRAGQPVSPLVEGRLSFDDNHSVTLLGIEPLSLPTGTPLDGVGHETDAARLSEFLLPPYRTRLAPDTLARLGFEDTSDVEDQRLVLPDGRRLPPLQLDPSLPPGTLVTDIAAAQPLLDMDTHISRLVASPEARLTLPAELQRLSSQRLASPGQLTDSFHLNLTAMGLLALVVGLFIVHAALGLALEQRLGLLRTLRALGVSGRALVGLLMLEMLMLGLVGAGLGILSGVSLARLLLPDVAASLEALYAAEVGTRLALPGYYWLGGLMITVGGLFSAGAGLLWRAARLNPLALGHAQTWRAGYRRQLGRMQLAGTLLLSVAAGLWLILRIFPATAPGRELNLGFALVAALLLGTALWLPPLLAATYGLATRLLGRSPLGHWAAADLQLQLPRLALAMMALLLALSANLGVGSMVGGFRLTFLDWLDQRLLADLYVHPDGVEYEAVQAWLRGQPEVDVLLPRRQADTTRLDAHGNEMPVAVNGIAAPALLRERWPLLATLAPPETEERRDAAWDAFERNAALINEQLAHRTGLAPGDRLTLRTPDGLCQWPIAAIYPDYGNPGDEVTLPVATLSDVFRAPPGTLGIVLSAPETDATRLRQALAARFGLGDEALSDPREIKRLSVDIFERTFAVTRALNALTLGVAALALATTLLAQASPRRAQLAPLWALGVSRASLVLAGLGQLSATALVTGLLAVPLGLALAWCLVAVINVAAFGWRLPLHVFPGQIAVTLIMAVTVTALAALLPLWRLWRTPPRRLLEEFASA
ncbi:ABC transporter permease [Halomonas sp. WWR20]